MRILRWRVLFSCDSQLSTKFKHNWRAAAGDLKVQSHIKVKTKYEVVLQVKINAVLTCNVAIFNYRKNWNKKHGNEQWYYFHISKNWVFGYDLTLMRLDFYCSSSFTTQEEDQRTMITSGTSWMVSLKEASVKAYRIGVWIISYLNINKLEVTFFNSAEHISETKHQT